MKKPSAAFTDIRPPVAAERPTADRVTLTPETPSIHLPMIEMDDMAAPKNEAQATVLSDSLATEADQTPDGEWDRLVSDEVLEIAEAEMPSELLDFPGMPEMALDAVWPDEGQAETFTLEVQTAQIREQLTEYLEALEPDEAETAVALAATIVQTARQLYELAASEDMDIEAVERTRQELKELCVQLFEHLGLDYDEAAVERFLQSAVRAGELADGRPETADSSMEEGTHEQRLGSFDLLNDLSQLIRQKLPSLYMLGRLALRSEPFIFASPMANAGTSKFSGRAYRRF